MLYCAVGVVDVAAKERAVVEFAVAVAERLPVGTLWRVCSDRIDHFAFAVNKLYLR